MSRFFTSALIAAVALGTAVAAVEPASAMPVAGAAIVDTAAPAAGAVEQVQYYRHRGYRRPFARGYGFRRGYGYRRGYRRGLPGHPIRRILRAL
ncbi:MAG: hypothetical protein ACRYGP_21755 [Janthinobacterium lividum]